MLHGAGSFARARERLNILNIRRPWLMQRGAGFQVSVCATTTTTTTTTTTQKKLLIRVSRDSDDTLSLFLRVKGFQRFRGHVKPFFRSIWTTFRHEIMCCFGVAQGTIWRPQSCSLAPSSSSSSSREEEFFFNVFYGYQTKR